MKPVPRQKSKSLVKNMSIARSSEYFQHPIAGRRWFLATSGAASFLFGLNRNNSAHANQEKVPSIIQPKTSGDMAFIEIAFEMRQRAIAYGDQAYGAVIALNGKVIGQSWSRVILDQDPTGHAEMSAIRDAAHRLSSRDLAGAVIFSSSRPCPMCEAAAYWAGIKQMIHGRQAIHAGAPRLCR